jgi:Holliday junction resolvase RusA-like endonuclease
LILFNTFIATEPRGKGRHRTTKGGKTYPDPKTARAEERIQWQVANEFKGDLFTGPLAVTIFVDLLKPASKPKKKPCWPTGKPDADNYAKLVLDACNGILWKDDAQVVELHVSKSYGAKPGFQILVESVEAVA